MKPNSPRSQASAFFNRIKNKVADRQQYYTEAAMKILFRESPHYMETIDKTSQEGEHGNTSEWAKGEYDANHKIVVGLSPASTHNPPTHSHAGSYVIHTLETQKAKTVKSGSRVRIVNTTPHKYSVEYGAGYDMKWQKPGYYPYSTTKKYLRRLAEGNK